MRIWKQSPSFPEIEVSSDGKVRKTGKIKPMHQTNGGYMYVSFGGGTISVHRLVADTFLTDKGVRETANKNCVNHLNGKTYDNRVENLEWCSSADNTRHAWRTGLIKPKERIYPIGERSKPLTMKQLRTLASKYYGIKGKRDSDLFYAIFNFLDFVESQRSSLTSKHVKK